MRQASGGGGAYQEGARQAREGGAPNEAGRRAHQGEEGAPKRGHQGEAEGAPKEEGTPKEGGDRMGRRGRHGETEGSPWEEGRAHRREEGTPQTSGPEGRRWREKEYGTATRV